MARIQKKIDGTMKPKKAAVTLAAKRTDARPEGPMRILVGQAQVRTEKAPEWAVPKSSIHVHFTSFLTYLHELGEASAEVAHPTFFKLMLDLPEAELKYVIASKEKEEDCYSYMYGPVAYDYFERLVQMKKAETKRFDRVTGGIGQAPKTEPLMDASEMPSPEMMEARRKAMRLFSDLLDLPLQTVIDIMNKAASAKTVAERMAILAELDRAIGLSKKMDGLGGNGQ